MFAGQRIDNPGPAWQMPQGGIDEGEEPRAAALRELVEETGIPERAVEVIGETAGAGSPTTCRRTWCRGSGRGGSAARGSAGS